MEQQAEVPFVLLFSGAINIWLSGGCPPEKLVVGMGMYGRSFKLPSWSSKNPVPGTQVQGLVCTLQSDTVTENELVK